MNTNLGKQWFEKYYKTMEKMQVIQEILDVDWTDIDVEVSRDLLRLIRSVVEDTQSIWYDDEEFIMHIADNFTVEHPVWDYIEIH